MQGKGCKRIMSMNSPDYLTYKKSKINPQDGQKKRVSNYRIALWIFIITFSVIFAIVVQVVRKYSTKIDIEYGRNADSTSQQAENSILSQGFGSETKKLIDNRLKLIQLEENAPNEAKILNEEKEKNEVIDLEQFAQIKQSGSEEDEQLVQDEIDTKQPKDLGEKPTVSHDANIAVYSKVLIGKYATFEDARNAQDSVREVNQGTTPFIRKVGDIYALQVGSYQDLTTAKKIAAKFRAQDFDVWIYQQ